MVENHLKGIGLNSFTQSLGPQTRSLGPIRLFLGLQWPFGGHVMIQLTQMALIRQKMVWA